MKIRLYKKWKEVFIVEILIKATPDEVVKLATQIVVAGIQQKPKTTLGLATGNTMMEFYGELRRLHKAGQVDFSESTGFNLDEYWDFPQDNPESFYSFMFSNFYGHVNVPKERIFIPKSTVPEEELDTYCQWYEAEIKKAGGIDDQILGIGRNGHIGFNEPSSSLASRTRLVVLTDETLMVNWGTTEGVPRYALTMGVGTILEAKRCILLATGEKKANAVANCIEGPVSTSCPASALQLHQNTIIILDESAASKLKRRSYYNLKAAKFRV
jgi:glucosamine-6-phosphate deaminase